MLRQVRDSSFHASERIGANQSITPEGFLICESVPIARTGLMVYGAGEILSEDGEALQAGSDGIIRVMRDEDQVFHPDTIASFMGKPVTDDHPSESVTPANWRRVSIGEAHNVRRGEGMYSDCLVADLLIKDADAIKAVRDGKREVSCGYDADYEQSEPGRARQFNIIGNHVALVDRGRCGPRCSIGDRAMATKDKKLSFFDRLAAKLKGSTTALTADAVLAIARDAEKEDKEDEDKDKDGKETKDNIAKIFTVLDGITKRLDARDAGAEGEEEEMTEDAEGEEGEDDDTEEGKKKKAAAKDAAAKLTIDSKTITSVLQTVRANSEILAPGHKLAVPTFDAATTRVAFADSMCNCKRKALDVAYRTDEGKAAIEPFLNGRTADFSRMNSKTIDVIFTGAAVLRAQRNNDASSRGIRPGLTRDDFGRAPLTNDELNTRNKDFWAKQSGAAK